MAVKPIPDGYHTVTPYLICKGAAQALDFYKHAFGAKEELRMAGPDGSVSHAEITIGDSRLMLGEEHPAMGARSPATIGGSGTGIMLYVEDVDKMFQNALKAGATQTQPVQDKFYGDRMGTLTDPFGHVWHIATHIEDVSPEEMSRRHEEFAKSQSGS